MGQLQLLNEIKIQIFVFSSGLGFPTSIDCQVLIELGFPKRVSLKAYLWQGYL
jgi:hypothetical protein